MKRSVVRTGIGHLSGDIPLGLIVEMSSFWGPVWDVICRRTTDRIWMPMREFVHEA